MTMFSGAVRSSSFSHVANTKPQKEQPALEPDSNESHELEYE